MNKALLGLERLEQRGFNVDSRFYAKQLLAATFEQELSEITQILLNFRININEIVRGGGGKAPHTKRLGDELLKFGWPELEYHIEKNISVKKKKQKQNLLTGSQDKVSIYSNTHLVDHVKVLDNQNTLALEIEWNNKDPFFNRDLEAFSRLHAEGALVAGILITRGKSMQDGLQKLIQKFADMHRISTIESLRKWGYSPTDRQRDDIKKSEEQHLGERFSEIWSKAFVGDKFGRATTHWDKLTDRLDRGIGAPCPILSIGLPLNIIALVPDK